MADIATLAIKVENGDVPKATASLDALTVAGTKSEAAAQRLTRRMALLEIEARGMDASMGKSHLSFVHLAEGMGLGETAAAKLMKTLGALGALAVVGLIGHKVVEESIAAQNAMAQLEAAVDSTGGVAGRTAEQLEALSRSCSSRRRSLMKPCRARRRCSSRSTKSTVRSSTRRRRRSPISRHEWAGICRAPPSRSARRCKTQSTALPRCGRPASRSPRRRSRSSKICTTPGVSRRRKRSSSKDSSSVRRRGAAARDTLGGALAFLKNQWNDLFEVSKSSSTGIVQAINAMGEALPEIRSAFNAFFGGFALLSVDAAVAWQKFLNLFRREAGLNDALDKWKEEQYALITARTARPTRWTSGEAGQRTHRCAAQVPSRCGRATSRAG
jgi:hypothetical protein